jgi:hypothetical protein
MKFRIMAETRQHHDIGTIEAATAEEAVKKAEILYAAELKTAAARCPKTGQIYDVHALPGDGESRK